MNKNVFDVYGDSAYIHSVTVNTNVRSFMPIYEYETRMNTGVNHLSHIVY
jgi:hypothetical protein